MARTYRPDEGFQAIRAEDIVGDIARHRAGALEVMARMGINHCCGAQLTLNEAAAATGVPLDQLLRALNEGEPNASSGADGRRTVLDVRGLEPPKPLVCVLEALDRLGPGVQLEVRHDRRPILLYPQLDDRGFIHETDEPEPGLVRIVIRKAEV